jgi:hypothetical protein
MGEQKSQQAFDAQAVSEHIDKGFLKVMDSGVRQEFATGSVRDTREGKGRYDLIPPYALKRLAQHYENGAKKYGDRNWEKGQNLTRYIDSAIRHLESYLAGAREEDHLAAAAWNVFSVIATEQWIKEGVLPPELNDLPVYVPMQRPPTSREEKVPGYFQRCSTCGQDMFYNIVTDRMECPSCFSVSYKE